MGIGIMLTLALCITHSEPATTTAIRKVVQAKIAVFARWLRAEPRCRKYTSWTNNCATHKVTMSVRRAPAGTTFDMTAPNEARVNATERMKPDT